VNLFSYTGMLLIETTYLMSSAMLLAKKKKMLIRMHLKLGKELRKKRKKNIRIGRKELKECVRIPQELPH
jgi:hypothetical protein